MNTRVRNYETFYNLDKEADNTTSASIEEDEPINNTPISDDVMEMASKILSKKTGGGDIDLKGKTEEQVNNIKSGIKAQNTFTEKLGAISNFIFKPNDEGFSNAAAHTTLSWTTAFTVIWVLCGIIGVMIAYFHCGPSKPLSDYKGMTFGAQVFRLGIKYWSVFIFGIIYTPYKLCYGAGMGHFRHFADFCADASGL